MAQTTKFMTIAVFFFLSNTLSFKQTLLEFVMSSKPLVVFTPSGKRGHFEKGTSILQIARKLGVDLDSVCGGRGICSKCQITPSYGEFTKHGVTVSADVSLTNACISGAYMAIR